MRLQTTQAIYTNGKLIFLDPALAPRDGMEVVVTFLEEPQKLTVSDTIRALRGRGRGEDLVERLLQSRQEDRAYDERVPNPLRA